MAVDYILLWNEQHEAVNRQKQIFHDGRSFWEDPKNVRRFQERLSGSDRTRIERQLAVMRIPPGSSVLDIGAGPGTLAVPLALAGCSVTTVEPSVQMRNAMEEYRTISGAPEIRQIPCRWEDVSSAEIGTHDVVIASLSLGLDDIRSSLLKMDAAARHAVHLFWFLTPPSWALANAALWPRLHNRGFVSEPTADVLWGCLSQLGIYADLSVEQVKKERRYATEEEIVSHYCRRMYIHEEWQRKIVVDYVHEQIVRTGEGFYVPGGSRTAHIRWEKGR